MTNNRFGRDMKLKDLEIGQTLFEATPDTWGRNVGGIYQYTVTKMTKTRLVITRVGTEPPVQTRVVVRDGAVSQKVEGQSEWSSGVALYTTDDPELAKVRREARHARALNRARAATAEFDKKRDKENALAAIDALRKFIDATEPSETDPAG